MKPQLVGNTHLIAGRPDSISRVLTILEGMGEKTRGNPDVYVRVYQQFGIDEARELRERAASRAFGARRIFVMAAPTMTGEAQNALLKTLEEPSADALFFFIVPTPETLLPTLRSRAQTLVLQDVSEHSKVDAKRFVSSLPKERLDMLKPLLAKDDDDKRDLGAIVAFLGSLERIVGARDGLAAIYRARKYVTDKGALVKPLLEQVALLTPRI